MLEGFQEGPLIWFSHYAGYRVELRSLKKIPMFVHLKSFRNLIKSNRNQIVFTMHRLIWNQTDGSTVSQKRKHGFFFGEDRVSNEKVLPSLMHHDSIVARIENI